jgi:F-type H+-transporting ATPase subunit b
MEGLAHALGVNWWQLAAQLVTFLVLLGVLTKLLYRPFLAHLQARSERIAKSLEDAERIDRELKETERKTKASLDEARREAQRIVERVTAEASDQRQAMLDGARQEAESLVSRAREQMEQERETMLREVRGEVVDLVVEVAEKVIGERLNEAQDRRLVDRTLEEFAERTS